jgi:hypothetical protein
VGGVGEQLKAINAASLKILADARMVGDPDTQLKAIDRIHKQIELQAKLLGEIDDRPQVNILVSPEWQGLRNAVLVALVPYPEARLSVVDALAEWEPPRECALCRFAGRAGSRTLRPCRRPGAG